MTLRVHIMHQPDAHAVQVLHDSLPGGIELTFGPEPPGTPFQVLVAGRPTQALLDASPELHTLVIPWAGLPKPTAELLAGRDGIAVHNLHHNAPATAEMAVALMLAAAKSVPRADAMLRRGDWSLRFDHGNALQLEGRHAVVLGVGAIGQRVARACLGLGMSVTGVSRSGRSGSPGIEMLTTDALPQALPRAQVLHVCVPATPETEGMLSAERLALLPPDAILVNIARGAVIDEPALYEALKGGALFAAGLDVWWRYPGADDDRADFRPSNQPFHELPNVVFSPHRGGHVKDTEQQRMRALAALLAKAAAGRPMPNRVELARGY